MKSKLSVCGIIVFVILGPLLNGCATVGTDFDATRVSEIVRGETNQKQIENMFGQPTRVENVSGLPNGAVERYTYQYGRASMGGMKSKSKALVVDFDSNKIVVDYSYAETG